MPEPAEPRGVLLAFDFGLKRIGVAVGQTTTRTANPLAVVASSSGTDWQRISELVEEWRPRGAVVGLPLDAEGQDTEMSRAARRFGAELEKRYSIAVYFADERLTSRQAESQFAAMRARGELRRKSAARLDAMAAKIILENWLQSLPAQGAERPGPD
jgi:putative Holliday junction resolvase